MLFCDPPGVTNPDALMNYGNDNVEETQYVFFHDQEPVHLDVYESLFDEVLNRCLDLHNAHHQATQTQGEQKCLNTRNLKLDHKKASFGHIVVSEISTFVQQLCDTYGWHSHYYFYHGWACQDWFRGYDKTFLIPRAQHRTPAKTFMSANRIIAGKRDHRVLFLYHLFKNNLQHNHISAPRHCVYEQVNIEQVAAKYNNTYHDIEQVFRQANLPRLFQGEETQQMSSCWLTNFAEAQDSLVYVPTETVYFGQRLHITEKTFKAIALEMPFVMVAPAHSLEYMRRYGFKTFDSVFDESYDSETNDFARLEKVVKLLKDLDSLSNRERQQIHRACLPLVEHNYNHFYRGGLTDVLWPELTGMLDDLRNKFHC